MLSIKNFGWVASQTSDLCKDEEDMMMTWFLKDQKETYYFFYETLPTD